MRFVRVAFLIPLLAGFALPAQARIDMDELARPFSVDVAASLREEAVETALAALRDGGDPVEAIVIDGVRQFYAARDFAPLWLGAPTTPPSMTALRKAMDSAAEYGLDPRSYSTLDEAGGTPASAAALAEADVAFSVAVARFVTHIASGRVRPSDISKLITLEPERPDISAALTQLAASADVAADLAAYEPPHEQYRLLKSALAALRSSPDEAERIVVPDGGLLKPGRRDVRVPILRARLGIAHAAPDTALPDMADADLLQGDAQADAADPASDADVYDARLVEAVKALQAEHGLTPDGIVGPRTLIVMNGRDREAAIASVIANMERWRWMPRDLGAFHIFVNVPEFVVRVVSDGTVVHETRVVVGKPGNPTPTFSNAVSHLIVNPYWNVPTSIVSKEMLPEIRRDPYGYFARQGYQVFARIGGKMRQVDPRWIDWYMINPRSVQIRQIPGDFNALGRIKFMFPNQHSVYLHDTPSKSLFKRDYRAFSHGCVRVENPMEFADVLLAKAAPDWNSARLEKLFGGPERRVNLDSQVPVHLAYFTDWVMPDGTLRHMEDIYGYDGEMAASLGS